MIDLVEKRLLQNLRNAEMLASVIIVTRNRAELLTRCLTALVGQTSSPDTFEVIVVDDGSQDNTRSACHLMRKKIPKLRYLSTGSHIGLSAARNLGIQQAKGQYLIFTDDDCIATADWLVQMKKALDERAIIAGAVTTSFTHFLTICHNVAQFHQFMPRSQQGPSSFIAGANMGFRRSVLDRLGGFRETGYAGETELILRARQEGYTIWFVPEAVVIHDPRRTTWAAIFRYASEHAAATIILRNRYRSLLRTPLVLRSPILLLLASPIIALKVTVCIYVTNPRLRKLAWTGPVVFLLKLAWCYGACRALTNHGRDSLWL